MKYRVLLMALLVALAVEVSPAAMAQGNSNSQGSSTKSSGKMKHKRAHAKAAVGIPNGAAHCVAKLEQLAGSQAQYEAGPSKIINEGLLWNDPKSKCSVGSDQALRNKILDLATAWQLKDWSKVQSLLPEIKSAVPAASASTEAAPHHRRTKHRTASSGNSNTAK
jgi:hypothetical protein